LQQLRALLPSYHCGSRDYWDATDTIVTHMLGNFPGDYNG